MRLCHTLSSWLRPIPYDRKLGSGKLLKKVLKSHSMLILGKVRTKVNGACPNLGSILSMPESVPRPFRCLQATHNIPPSRLEHDARPSPLFIRAASYHFPLA